MISDYFGQFLQGSWITLNIAILALTFGMVLGMMSAFLQLSAPTHLARIFSGFTALIRSTPELLILFFIYYSCSLLLTRLCGHYVEINTFFASICALATIFAAYAAEVIKGVYHAIPQQQIQAAKALALSPRQCFVRITLPLMWPQALPGLMNLWLVLLKDTALVALIGLPDLMQIARNSAADTQKPLLCYSVAASIYLCLTSLSLLIQRFLQPRYLTYRHHD